MQVVNKPANMQVKLNKPGTRSTNIV